MLSPFYYIDFLKEAEKALKVIIAQEANDAGEALAKKKEKRELAIHGFAIAFESAAHRRRGKFGSSTLPHVITTFIIIDIMSITKKQAEISFKWFTKIYSYNYR